MAFEIGKKIRELRLSKKMTQAALAGSQISRNMICLIESGKTVPSVETLLYIANRLGVSAGYLLSEDENLAFYKKVDVMTKIKPLYLAKNWQGMIACFEGAGIRDDEIMLLQCECYMHIGIDAYRNKETQAARDALNRAMWFSKRTAYQTDAFCDMILLYLYALDELQFGTGSGVLPEVRDRVKTYVLLQLLASDEETADQMLALLGRGFSGLIWQAKTLIDRKRDSEARNVLLACLKDPKLSDEPILLLYVYTSLEKCSHRLADFESAYKYANMKNELLLSLKNDMKMSNRTDQP